MTEILKFTAERKTLAGKGSARSLRREGKIPAVFYSGGNPAEMAVLSAKEFNKEYKKGGIRTRIAEVIVDGKPVSAITKDVQLHPVSDNPIHVDFLKVDKDTIMKVAVAIKVTNEDKSTAIKKGAIVNMVHRTIEFYCHPSDIPHHIEVDVANLEIGQNIHINDVPLPKGIKAVDKTNFTVVSLVARVDEVIPTAQPTAEGAAVAAADAEAAPAAAPTAK